MRQPATGALGSNLGSRWLCWGWLWGPAGMLFCVPLTVIAKLIMEGNDDTRWIAIFLGSTLIGGAAGALAALLFKALLGSP